MKYTAIFEITPSGLFGLPEGDRTALPAPAQFIGDTFYALPGNRGLRKVGWGSVSVYRQPEIALNEQLNMGDTIGHMTDNYVSLSTEADNPDMARDRLLEAADRIVQHLTLKYRIAAGHMPVVMYDEDREAHPIRPASITAASLRTYNIDELRDEVRGLQSFVPLEDDRLHRAMTYFQHAVWLFEQQQRSQTIRVGHLALLSSAVFLNLWKAITTIVGDPREKDYQRRYRELGFDYQFFQGRIDKITRMRNDLDVAHHHLDAAALATVDQAFGEALDTAAQVISRYREKLAEQAVSTEDS